jgi:hypothetical protein
MLIVVAGIGPIVWCQKAQTISKSFTCGQLPDMVFKESPSFRSLGLALLAISHYHVRSICVRRIHGMFQCLLQEIGGQTFGRYVEDSMPVRPHVGIKSMEAAQLSPMPASRLPRFWDRLSVSDQSGYLSLRTELAMPQFSNQRGRSKAQFGVMLDLIKTFVVRGDVEDLGRALVCGVIWLSNGIAVNIQQLKMLSSKCKSSINGSLGAFGYATTPSGADTAGELIQKFPFMKDQFSELRQWTIRRMQTKKEKQRNAPPQFSDIFDGMSLDTEYAKLFHETCQSGSLDFCTPPPGFDDQEFDDGIFIGMHSPKGPSEDGGSHAFRIDDIF